MQKVKQFTECSICKNDAELEKKDFGGYQEGTYFDIYSCKYCDTNFASPIEDDFLIYEAIYKNASTMPGYNRYFMYAESVKKFKGKDALKYIGECESIYYPVYDLLKSVPGEVKILEIGSGLGYLTYALNEYGLNALGVDISETAVNEATKRFGSFYKKMDITNDNLSGYFDYVICTEVIEHVEEPVLFMNRMTKFLKNDGKLFVSSPSKNIPKSKNVYWASDLPPVHHWWFSELSMRYMCKNLNLDIEFYDYESWNLMKYPRGKLITKNIQKPVLDKNGSPINPEKIYEKKDSYFEQRKKKSKFNRYKKYIDTSKSTCFFAIISKIHKTLTK